MVVMEWRCLLSQSVGAVVKHLAALLLLLLLRLVLLQVVASISSFLPDLTVGLIATLTTVACIIAADTGAYFVGKNLGRTKLTDISPKKTVEGALGGLASAVAVAVLFWKLFSWPGNVLAAAGYGVSDWAGPGRHGTGNTADEVSAHSRHGQGYRNLSTLLHQEGKHASICSCVHCLAQRR